MPGATPNHVNQKAGLAYWSQRVLEELDKVAHNFDPDPVHDLRVALRRCRSMADGFLVVDPDPGWKELKKIGKNLFSRLGDLRDVQVMEEWTRRLGGPEDSVRQCLLAYFASKEVQLKSDARMAIHAFDRKHWELLAERLAKRAHAIPIEGLVFQHLALERWQQAHELHRQALRNRSQIAYHRLRIGLKKFRYMVENFLPQRHAKWGSDLKQLQDLLGEVHDLDVLAAVLKISCSADREGCERWAAGMREQRNERLGKYRERMLGHRSLWHLWRAELPRGARLEQAALARLRTWASFLDPDIEHTKHVTDLALQLYDGLARDGVLHATPKQRRILQTAALLHEVGSAKGKRAHHKQSARLICKLNVPLGWTPEELRAVGAVARYHRGALPRPEHKCLRQLPPSVRSSVVRLAGVLRLANAFDWSHDRKVRRLQIVHNNGTVVVRSEGYNPVGPTAERIAAARHLLEASCEIAVLVRPS